MDFRRRGLNLALGLGIPCAVLTAVSSPLTAGWIEAHLPSPEIHAALEWATVFPALAIAYAGIAGRRAGANVLGLFLGLAFLASALIDACHPFGTLGFVEPWFRPNRGADMWTWTLARLLTSAFAVAGGLLSVGRRVPSPGARTRFPVALVTVAAFCVCALVFTAPSHILASPVGHVTVRVLDVISAAAFAGAFVTYERAYRLSLRPLWRNVAVAFLLMTVTEIVIQFSQEPLDGPFFAAHFFKFAGYSIAFAGLLADHGFLTARERDLRRGLESERRRLQRVLDTTSDGIVVVDRDDGVALANPSAHRHLGARRGISLVGRELGDILAGRTDLLQGPAKVEYGHGFMLDQALQGTPGGGMICVGPEGARRWVEAHYAPMSRLPGEPISGVVVTLRDVTALRQLEEARASTDAMARTVRERDEFLSVASHELKTPLTAAKMTVESIVRRAERGTVPDLFALKRTERQVDRLAAVVEDLLEVSRLRTGTMALKRESFDYVDLVRQYAASLASDERFDDLHVELPNGSITVEGDPGRLVQVLGRLVTNAFKYSPRGKPIEIVVRDAPDGVHTTVADRGIGIPAGDLPGLFSRFSRGGNVRSLHYAGLGLGLYISAEIVRHHGGRIGVESREGNGSRFSFTLPRSAPRLATREWSPEPMTT
jgi:two-component system sensor kinase FixL